MNCVNKATLFYTNLCNVNCEHCFISPLRNDKGVFMNQDIFDRAMKLFENFNVTIISISGGEPMIFWNNIVENINNNGGKCIFPFSICTNAYWGRNEKERIMILNEMKECGISRLELSSDSYHNLFIDLDSVILPVIKDAQNIGLDVYVTICLTKLTDEIETIGKLMRVIDDPSKVIIRFVSDFGEAKNSVTAKKQKYGIDNFKCSQAGSPTVMYNGDVFLCCGPPIAIGHSKYYLGNVNNDSIESISDKLLLSSNISKLQNNKLVDLVPNYQELFNLGKVKSVCELCILFMENQ